MATVTVNINATDNMSPVLAALQAQLNQLQQQANINLGGRMGQAANQMMNYTTRLYENMLNSLGTKLWKTFTNNLKSAYQEIKAIDDELVVVRRVTGKTNEELAGMSRNAMKVAQTYGVSASKYLSGVADFTRAGYQDQAEGLAELSVKLQRAGDVSADVANQYVLAIDKAYGLQGNIEALTAAMDGANQIGNEYATNVGEIAAGIGKLATIAATAHVGIGELTAALGTVTAVTQRSGTEAATALRAIFLNIMGDTTTEIEDGAKWTAGEIEGLRDVLELYAPEVVRAAEATGTLIDPMEAIGALAKSYQKGILTEAKLFSMVSDIGGKLRTNQLMVLIKSWDMYESMLKTYAGASGSIDREVQNSLDSITVKTERLKASWVALVNDTISTGMIKDSLDVLNTVVQSVGNLANALAIVLGLVTALKAQRLATLTAGLFGMNPASIASMTSAFRGFGLAITAIGVALSVANGIIKNHNEGLDKSAQAAVQSANKASQTGQEIMKLYSNFVTAKAGTEQYTTALKALAEALGITANEADKAGDSIKNLALQKMQQAAADARAALLVYNTEKGDKWFPKSFTVDFGEYVGELQNIVFKYRDFFEWTDGDRAIFSSDAKIEDFVTQYEAAEKLEKELNQYAAQAGIDITKFKPYMLVHDFLQETKTQYQEAHSLLTAYANIFANIEYASMPGYENMQKMMTQLNEGGNVSVETLREFATEWDNLISSISDSDFEGHGKWVRESLVGILDKEFPQIAKYSRMWHEMMNPDGNGMADSADNAADSVNRLAVALNTATKAKNAFDAAMERDAENKGFTDYQSAYAAYAEEMEAGRVGSRRAMAAAQYLMAGSDKWNYDVLYAGGGYKAVNAAMAEGPWKTVYGDKEKTYGEGFLDLLGRLADKKTGEIKLNDKVVASYKRMDDSFEFTIDDLRGLADATDMSLGQVWQAIEAVGVYGGIDTNVKQFTDSLLEMGEAAGVTADSTGRLSIDYRKLLQYMEQTGRVDKEWESMKNWLDILNEIGLIDLNNVPDVEGGWQNYDDATREMRSATEHSLDDVKKIRAELEEAERIAAESTPGALGLPTDTKGLEGVTAQVATMNNFLNDMRIAGNDDGAAQMLAKLNNAAQMAGGSLEIVDGQIKAIKDSAGNDADWDFLSKLINTTGMAAAAPTENGMVIAGLEDMDYQITYTVDPDGSAQLRINQLLNESQELVQTRDINFNANGEINNIDTVTRNANEAAEDRVIGFYTEGHLHDAIAIEEEAGKLARVRHIEFDTDGKITNLEVVDNLAEGLTNRKRTFTFGAKGEVTEFSETRGLAENLKADGSGDLMFGADPTELKNKLPEITALASDVTTKVRDFQYGADGEILNAEITTIDNKADEPTYNVRMIHFDGDTKAFDSKANALPMTAEEKANAASNKAIIQITANPDGADQALDDIQKSVLATTASVNNGDFGTFNLSATITGVTDGLSQATKAISETIAKTDTTFHLKVDSAGVDFTSPLALFQFNPLNPSSPLHPGSFNPTHGVPLNQMLNGINPNGNGTLVSSGKGDFLTTLHDYMSGILSGDVQRLYHYNSDSHEIYIPPDMAPKGPNGESVYDMPPVTGSKYVYIPEDRGPKGPDGRSIYSDTVVVEGELEITPDKASAEEAAAEAQKIATLTLGANPVPFIPTDEYDGEYAGQWNGNDIYTVSFEVENEGVFDDIMYISQQDGKPHVISIQTAGDGMQTITETVYTLDGLVESQNVITIDAEGNAETNLESIEATAELLDRAVTLSVYANTSDSQSRLNRLKNTLDNIKSKTVTVTTKTAGESITKNAKGTDYFKGGYSLINEEGPELVAADGMASIYAHGFPTIAQIPKGARIYTAQETAALLGGKMSLPAYASGKNTSDDAFKNPMSDIVEGLGKSTGSKSKTFDETLAGPANVSGQGKLPKKPKEEEEEEEKEKGSGGGGNGGGSSKSEDEESFWDTIRKFIDYGLKKIQYQIDSYQDDITAIERARDALIRPIEEELEDLDYALSLLQYEVTLLERARDDAVKPLDKEIERLEKARDISKEEVDLEEKRKALEDARHQRTIRYFNEESGQWEWMADQKAIKSAEDAYNDALAEQEINLLKRERDVINDQYQEQIDAFEEQEEVLKRRQEDLEHERQKIEYTYGESIDPLQEALDRLQENYDDLEKFYNRLVDAVEVPTEDLAAALKEMASAQENYTAQLEHTVSLLDALYSLAPTWSAVEVSDIGKYIPANGEYGGEHIVDQSTNITVNGITIEGDDAKTVKDIFAKYKLYKG